MIDRAMESRDGEESEKDAQLDAGCRDAGGSALGVASKFGNMLGERREV